MILPKVDRASMLNSLEVRTPFLDVKFAEFIFTLQDKFKFKNFTGKTILRKALKDSLAKKNFSLKENPVYKIIERKKMGFGCPLSNWLKNELKDKVNDVLNSKKLKNEGIFNTEFTKKIIKEHQLGISDNRKQIWSLLSFQMWKDNFFD
jgi:asparagine synthase (glutamine-hydrolysing)